MTRALTSSMQVAALPDTFVVYRCRNLNKPLRVGVYLPFRLRPRRPFSSIQSKFRVECLRRVSSSKADSRYFAAVEISNDHEIPGSSFRDSSCCAIDCNWQLGHSALLAGSIQSKAQSYDGDDPVSAHTAHSGLSNINEHALYQFRLWSPRRQQLRKLFLFLSKTGRLR